MAVVGGGPAGAAAAVACARLGLEVLVAERGGPDRHKPCGGVLPPACADVISYAMGREMPAGLMCSPGSLGLCYVPPGGRRGAGILKGYRLLNVDRDRLDRWLRDVAVEEGVQIAYGTSLVDFRGSGPIRVAFDGPKGRFDATARYLIGADGVYSGVRRKLFGAGGRVAHVLQEWWNADGDFEDCFYALFRGAVSSSYSYVIPKDGLLVVGVGAPSSNASSASCHLARLREWLAEEFGFRGRALVRREAWAIPYGFVKAGTRDIILVGDAAGLCNPLSGEGFRLALESGEAAGAAVEKAAAGGENLARAYGDLIEPLAGFVRRTHEFASSMTDEDRERFVRAELSRVGLS